MEVFLNAAALAKRCGQRPYRFELPPHDVEISRYRGWHPSRVNASGGVGKPVHREPLRLASTGDIAARLRLSRLRVADLTLTASFPLATGCIGDPAKIHEDAVWAGSIYGWDMQDVLGWASTTGRINAQGEPVRRAQTGRPRGSGDYASLPRCGRPKLSSVHGKGEPCKGVRRKYGDLWAPACAVHLTKEERQLMEKAFRNSILTELNAMMRIDQITDQEIAARLEEHKRRSPMTAPGQ